MLTRRGGAREVERGNIIDEALRRLSWGCGTSAGIKDGSLDFLPGRDIMTVDGGGLHANNGG